MKHTITTILVLISLLTHSQDRFDVSSESEFESALSSASSGDSIVWESGTYSNVFMDITKNGVIVTADVAGAVIFNGASKVEIDGDDVTLSGLQFVGGNIGTSHVIRIWGSDVLITQINIADYTCYKYLIVDEDSQRTTISYSNFENRLNLDDQNILSILVDAAQPGFHKIQYCSFKNFEGTGNDLGIEPIRIGVSSQGQFDSRTIVEYCYFTNCDGDGELISNKASQNVIRYNTFEENTKAELVLRHGDEAIVYGNFFLNNMGGVRVREGSGHYIYNNYFSGLDRRSIYLQNESSDPLSDIHVYFNTIVNSAEMILGSDGGNPPTNVTIANNIFADPTDALFEDATGNEDWISNLSFGTLGITRPSGLDDVDPKLSANSGGYVQPDSDSPAIDAADDGYPAIPLYSGLDYDNEVLLDLMKQSRPAAIADKDIGASEFSSSIMVQPHATEQNTGPTYLQEVEGFTIDFNAVTGGSIVVDPVLQGYPNGTVVTFTAVPDDGFEFTGWIGSITGTENPASLTMTQDVIIGAEFLANVLNAPETKELSIYPNPADDLLRIRTTENYSNASLTVFSLSGKAILSTEKQMVGDSLQLDISEMDAGTYILEVIFNFGTGDFSDKHRLKFIKN